MSVSKKKATTATEIRPIKDGFEKKSKATRRFPSVRLVKEKAVKPEPREFRPGGDMKREVRSNNHQMKVIMVRMTVT